MDKTSEARFLENLMIREWGLYTLLGSKPVTIFDIESSVIETEEELRVSYEVLKEILEKAENEKSLPEEERTAFNPAGIILPDFEEYKREWERGYRPVNHKKLWEEWTRNSRDLGPKFLLSERPYYEGHKIGLFINIPNLVYTLYRYQVQFSEIVGLTFDPQEIVHEIEDKQSLFWERVFQNHFLMGLICGYGEKSSYLFDWSDQNLPGVSKDRRNFFWNDQMSNQDRFVRSKEEICPKDLSIPVFFHFGLIDPQKESYELERQEIINFFGNKDFFEETRKILYGYE